MKPAAPLRLVARKSASYLGARADRRLPSLRNRLTRGLTIIIFHDVTDTPSEFQVRDNVYVKRQLFERQLTWLAERFVFIRPPQLPQFGGTATLPRNAALVTFDDAWAGVFRHALPVLTELNVPAMCFLNMATVAGDPDLAAVRLYERLRLSEEARLLERRVSGEDMEAVLAEVRCRYRDDAQFASFQGPTATARDLHNAVDGDADVWFGSHLYHHWDMRLISSEVYRRSLAADAEALAHYPNALPGFATPHGYDGDGDDQVFALARSAGHRAVFTVTRRQNDSCEGGVLDRLALPSARSTGRDWWYATHRARLVKRAKMR